MQQLHCNRAIFLQNAIGRLIIYKGKFSGELTKANLWQSITNENCINWKQCSPRLTKERAVGEVNNSIFKVACKNTLTKQKNRNIDRRLKEEAIWKVAE